MTTIDVGIEIRTSDRETAEQVTAKVEDVLSNHADTIDWVRITTKTESPS